MPGIDECLVEAMRLPGALGAAVVDWTSGLALGTVGEAPGGDHETTAAEAAELARLAAEHRAFAPEEGSDWSGADLPVEDLIVSNRDTYHVLRFVRTTFDSGAVKLSSSRGATWVAPPRPLVSRPRFSSLSKASRKLGRDTSKRCASSRSGSRRSPGRREPSRISRSRRSAMASASLAGRIGSVMEICGLLMILVCFPYGVGKPVLQ